jgi:thioredoxin 1
MPKGLLDWGEVEFNQLMKDKKSAVVDFRADWCHTCAVVEPVFSEVAKDNPGVTFSKVDVSKNQKLATKMGVMSLPNILVIKAGKVVDQIIGATDKSTLESKIKKIA